MSGLEVRIDSNRPIFISASADDIGAIFAKMTDADQVTVLSAMVEHMRPHKQQWDYISIALEHDVNRELRDALRSVLFPDLAAKDAEIAELDKANVAYVDANTGLIRENAELRDQIDVYQRAYDELVSAKNELVTFKDAEIAAIREALEWALTNSTDSDHPHYPVRNDDGRWSSPYLVSGTPFGGGVGEAWFDSALLAVEAAVKGKVGDE